MQICSFKEIAAVIMPECLFALAFRYISIILSNFTPTFSRREALYHSGTNFPIYSWIVPKIMHLGRASLTMNTIRSRN